jgi:hypothetical protein
VFASVAFRIFVFPSDIWERTDKNIRNCSLTCCFVWVETWAVMLKKEQGMIQIVVLKRAFGPKLVSRPKAGGRCVMGRSIIFTLHQILLGWSNQGSGLDLWHYSEVRNCYKILIGKPKQRTPLGGRSIILNLIWGGGGEEWWLYMSSNIYFWRAFMKALMNFRFHKRWGISILNTPLAYLGYCCSIDFVVFIGRNYF